MFADLDYDIEEDKLGIPTVPGKVTLQKDAQNLIGISIGGGAQYCPCLYIVQVFDNTPAALDGTVAAGDEITGVNGRSIKGKTKVEVAKMIQEVKGEVTIHYNKLQADPKQGMSLDIVLKKVKHRLVENMSSGTADALGLSRAILCNDGLVKRLEELERTAELYKGMTEHTKNLLRAFYELSQTHRAFGDVFSVIGVREPQPAASEAFVKFADAHRSIEKFGIRLLKTIKPMLTDLNTYLNKAIPDTRLTIKKYLDVKFEYLVSGLQPVVGSEPAWRFAPPQSATGWSAEQGQNLGPIRLRMWGQGPGRCWGIRQQPAATLQRSPWEPGSPGAGGGWSPHWGRSDPTGIFWSLSTMGRVWVSGYKVGARRCS
uniref:PRKCA-binding protein n=1 Tax=Sus scrofa TaxID=9823 RepID=A0A8D1NIX4_PIG